MKRIEQLGIEIIESSTSSWLHCRMFYFFDPEEMGFGKTSTSIASLELMDKWPVLVMCPGHMVWKWQRDLERSSSPEEPIVARVITRPVLAEPPTWLGGIRPTIEGMGGVIIESVREQVQPVTPNVPGGRRKMVFNNTQVALADLDRLAKKLSFKDPENKQVIPQPRSLKVPSVGVSAFWVELTGLSNRAVSQALHGTGKAVR
jgi:hypothetical protein